MTLSDIWDIVREQGSMVLGIIAILMTVVQITPIKVNPWSWLIKWLGRNLMSDLSTKVDELDRKLDEHIKESDERDLRKRRESILDFASAVANGRNYSKEQYEQMLRECDDYSTYCHKKKFINSVADESIKLIKDSYADHLKRNDFLQSIFYMKQKKENA